MNTYIHTYVHACMRAYIHPSMHACMRYVRTYVRTYCIYITCTIISVYIYVFAHVSICWGYRFGNSTFRTCIPLVLCPHLSGTNKNWVMWVLSWFVMFKRSEKQKKNIRLHPAFPKASWVSSAGKYWNGTRKYTKLAGYSATRFWNHDHMTIISNKMQQIHANSLKQTGLDLWCYLQWNLPDEGWLRRHQHGTCFTQLFSGGSAIHIAPIVAPSKRKLRTQIKLLR